MSRQRFMFILGALGAVVALSSVSASATAQQRSSPVRPPSASAPSGSYQQSCRGVNMNGNMLSAQCTNSSGAPVFSSLDTNSCRGRDIYNDNGYLRCGSGGGPVPPTPSVPTGSYQQSCRGASMSGNILRAQCTNHQGRPVSSSLDVNGCRGKDIRNDNGYLRCTVAPVPPTPSVPTGSYQQTCRGITMNGNILRAQCPNSQGRPVSSSLDINGCRGQDIRNDNGYLRCTASPVPPVPPPGGGDFQAIAYTSANFGGQQLHITAPIANLGNHRGFNDNIRSIRIIRGRAEVCVDSRYRGRCVTLSQSVSDLNRIGMGNRISSIR